ncbi:MAG: peptidase S41, partial [Chryseotalea sp.]
MESVNKFFRKSVVVTLVLSLFALNACDNDAELSGDAAINKWIYDNMKYYYLWTDEIPTSTNQNLLPEQYFESLLSDKDRFSWIQEDYEDLLKSLQG